MKKLIIIVLLLTPILAAAQKKVSNKSKMCTMLKEMMVKDQHFRKEYLGGLTAKKKDLTKTEIDSIWSLQLEIDDINTEKLIKLTKKYGWLSDERLECNKLNIWLVFRHSQEKHFKEIDELIEKEHSEGRLKESHYNYIKHHLAGRPKN